MKLQTCLLIAWSLSAIFAMTSFAQTSHHDQMGDMKMENPQPDTTVTNYPLDYCIVSGEKLNGEMGKPVNYDYHGRLIRFCCNGCVATFEKDPATYIAKLDSAIIAKEKPTYPLETCVVSGEKLGGDMGDPVDYVYNNHLVRFCCNDCLETFKKDPDQYLKKLHAPRSIQLRITN